MRRRIMGIIPFLLILLFLTGHVALAVPASFDWGSFNSSGLTTHGVYDTDNATILATGDLAQFIWAGFDGIPDAPGCDGMPGGDDLLLDTSIIQNESGPPIFWNRGYIFLSTYSYDTDSDQNGGTVFIRAWNAAMPASASAYGDSSTTTLVSGGVLNALRWHTDRAAHATWVGPDGGDWDTAENWDVNIVPGAGTVVTIPSGSVSLDADANAGCLTVEDGAILDIGAFSLMVEEAFTNHGTLQQTQTVNGAAESASVEFLHLTNAAGETVYRAVDISTVENLGDVTVIVNAIDTDSDEYCTNDGGLSPAYAERCFTVTSTTAGAATLTLWAGLDELNGILVEELALYRHVGGETWDELTVNPSNGTNNAFAFAQADTSGFSDFLIGNTNSGPTAISLRGIQGNEALPSFGLLVSMFVLLTGLTTFVISRRNAQA